MLISNVLIIIGVAWHLKNLPKLTICEWLPASSCKMSVWVFRVSINIRTQHTLVHFTQALHCRTTSFRLLIQTLTKLTTCVNMLTMLLVVHLVFLIIIGHILKDIFSRLFLKLLHKITYQARILVVFMSLAMLSSCRCCWRTVEQQWVLIKSWWRSILSQRIWL